MYVLGCISAIGQGIDVIDTQQYPEVCESNRLGGDIYSDTVKNVG